VRKPLVSLAFKLIDTNTPETVSFVLVLLKINHLRMKSPKTADKWLILNRLQQKGAGPLRALVKPLSNLSQQSSKKVDLADLSFSYPEGPEA